MGDFQNKTAVVTGAGGGMGLAIAAALVSQGARVAMLDIKPAPSLPTGPGEAIYHQGDLTDPAFIRTALSGEAKLDHLVNAAGVLWFDRDRGAESLDIETWTRVFDINLTAMLHALKAALPLLRANGGGSIVNISTIQCLRGDTAPQDAYQASKAGVIALTKSIAIQHAHEGIRANSLLPGPTESPMQARWANAPERRKATAEAVPLGRVGRVEDMAEAALFLLSERASFITGTELIVDGGLTALP